VTSQDNGVSGLKRPYSYICKGEKYVQQASLFTVLYFTFELSSTSHVFLQTISSTLSCNKANSTQPIKSNVPCVPEQKRERIFGF
jgi:hypothetical protein